MAAHVREDLSSSILGGEFAGAFPSGLNLSSASGSPSALGLSSASISTNSRAVLGALRALQEKIRRIESEKAKAEADAARYQAEAVVLQETLARERRDQAARWEAEEHDLRRQMEALRVELAATREVTERQRAAAAEAHAQEVQRLADVVASLQRERGEFEAALRRAEAEAAGHLRSLEFERGRVGVLEGLKRAAEERAEAAARQAEARAAEARQGAGERVAAANAASTAAQTAVMELRAEVDAARRDAAEARAAERAAEEEARALRRRVEGLSDMTRGLISNIPGSPSRRSSLPRSAGAPAAGASEGFLPEEAGAYRYAHGAPGTEAFAQPTANTPAGLVSPPRSRRPSSSGTSAQGGQQGGERPWEQARIAHGEGAAEGSVSFASATTSSQLKSRLPLPPAGRPSGGPSSGRSSVAAPLAVGRGRSSSAAAASRSQSASRRGAAAGGSGGALSSTVHEQLRDVSAGAIPFVLGTSAGPSHSVLANVQQTLAQPAFTTAVRPVVVVQRLPPQQQGRDPLSDADRSEPLAGGRGGAGFVTGAPVLMRDGVAEVQSPPRQWRGPVPPSSHADAAMSGRARSPPRPPQLQTGPPRHHTARHSAAGQQTQGSEWRAATSPAWHDGGGARARSRGPLTQQPAADAGAYSGYSRYASAGDLFASAAAGGPRLGEVVAAVPEAALGALLSSLQTELGQLEQQYDTLCTAASNRAASAADRAAATAGASEVLAAMDNKRSQLALLQHAEHGTLSGPMRSPVRNPEAAAKRVEALRTVAHLKELAHAHEHVHHAAATQRAPE